MKLVQTLVVRDEVDIVEDQLDYHLEAGVDFVIASDHGSTDGTTEILERYAREGHLLRIGVEGEMRDGPWRTHMARLAATEYGADWVINTDADEFWMPRGGTLREVLDSVPTTHGVVFARIADENEPVGQLAATIADGKHLLVLCHRGDEHRLRK